MAVGLAARKERVLKKNSELHQKSKMLPCFTNFHLSPQNLLYKSFLRINLFFSIEVVGTFISVDYYVSTVTSTAEIMIYILFG